MEQGHLEEVRRLIGANQTVPVRSPEMAVLEGERVATDVLATRTLGWSEKRHGPEFHSVMVCLRVFGARLLTHGSRSLHRNEYPGAFWLTLSCDQRRAGVLKRAATAAGFEMENVSDDVYVLVGTESSEPLMLSTYLDHADAAAPNVVNDPG